MGRWTTYSSFGGRNTVPVATGMRTRVNREKGGGKGEEKGKSEQQ